MLNRLLNRAIDIGENLDIRCGECLEGIGTAMSFDPRRGKETLLLCGRTLSLPRGNDGRHALSSAAWMPDGLRLLVAAGGDIFLVDVATTSVRPVVETEVQVRSEVAKRAYSCTDWRTICRN